MPTWNTMFYANLEYYAPSQYKIFSFPGISIFVTKLYRFITNKHDPFSWLSISLSQWPPSVMHKLTHCGGHMAIKLVGHWQALQQFDSEGDGTADVGSMLEALRMSDKVNTYKELEYVVRTLQACPLTPGQVISILCVHSASLSSHTRSGHINTLCALCKLVLSHQVRSYQYFVCALQACPLTPGQVISILCVRSASLFSHTRSGHINTLCALCKLVLSHQVRSYQYFVCTLQACPLTPGQVISILCVHSASLSSHTRSGHINTLCALCLHGLAVRRPNGHASTKQYNIIWNCNVQDKLYSLRLYYVYLFKERN